MIKTRKSPHYGNELKGIMRAKCLTQVDVARRLKMSQPNIWSTLQNPNPRIGTIRDICKICGVDVSAFIARAEAEASK